MGAAVSCASEKDVTWSRRGRRLSRQSSLLRRQFLGRPLSDRVLLGGKLERSRSGDVDVLERRLFEKKRSLIRRKAVEAIAADGQELCELARFLESQFRPELGQFMLTCGEFKRVARVAFEAQARFGSRRRRPTESKSTTKASHSKTTCRETRIEAYLRAWARATYDFYLAPTGDGFLGVVSAASSRKIAETLVKPDAVRADVFDAAWLEIVAVVANQLDALQEWTKDVSVRAEPLFPPSPAFSSMMSSLRAAEEATRTLDDEESIECRFNDDLFRDQAVCANLAFPDARHALTVAAYDVLNLVVQAAPSAPFVVAVTARHGDQVRALLSVGTAVLDPTAPLENAPCRRAFFSADAVVVADLLDGADPCCVNSDWRALVGAAVNDVVLMYASKAPGECASSRAFVAKFQTIASDLTARVSQLACCADIQGNTLVLDTPHSHVSIASSESLTGSDLVDFLLQGAERDLLPDDWKNLLTPDLATSGDRSSYPGGDGASRLAPHPPDDDGVLQSSDENYPHHHHHDGGPTIVHELVPVELIIAS